MLPVAW